MWGGRIRDAGDGTASGRRPPARAQSVQVGAILLFAVLILLLGLFQTNVVPEQNEQVEFDAYQEATSDMVELRTQVLRTASQSTQGSASIKTGVSYPARLLALNPPAPTGTVRMTERDPVTIENARAVVPDTAAYWDGRDRDFDTRRVVFRPSYNRFDPPPVTATGEFAYRDPPDGAAIFATGQTLLRGNRLSVVTIRGDLGVAGDEVPLTTEPTSASARTIRVTGSGSDDIVVEIPTTLPASDWQRLLSTELDSNGGNVEQISPNGDAVRIRLDGDETYELKLAQVEVRERTDDGVATEPSAAYLVRNAGDSATIVNTQTVSLTAQVRDTFNNPEPGAEVDFQVVSGTGSVTPTPVTTVGEGLATARFDPDDSYTGTAEIEATCIPCNGAGATTTFRVQVSGGPESVERPPSLEIVDIYKTGSDPDTYELDVEASDPDGNLDSVDFYLMDPGADDTPGNSLDSKSPDDVSGSSETVTVTLDRSVSGSTDLDEYHILVRVSDTDGLRNTDSVVVSGSGDDEGD
jgi:hypothetical protein